MRQIVGHARWKGPGFWIRIAGAAVMLVMLLVAYIGASRQVAHATTGDWPTYLGDLSRDGFNGAETIINQTTASKLKMHWSHSAGVHMASEPVEANGLIYWGSWDGLEHATDPSTGNDVWIANLGTTTSCYTYTIGVQSTATIASVLINGVQTTVDFVGGGDDKLYALDANNGGILWSTQLATSPSHFLYSSPAVFNGSVYIGVASLDDCPVIQGQMVQVDVSTGAIQHVFNLAPSGCIGGAVWSSPAIDEATGILYVSTGNRGLKCKLPEPYGSAVVALRASDLSFVDSWQIPLAEQTQDSDFGSTPTLFSATINGVSHQMLGLVNKNGIYYALDRAHLSAGPLWKATVGEPGTSPDQGKASIASSAWDGSTLYVASGRTTIQGLTCAGSLRAVNPSDGTFLWQFCTRGKVLAPVIAVPGVVVVVGASRMYVMDATSGKALFTFHDTNTNSTFWGAASISNGVLYVGNMDGNLYAFGL